MPTAAAEPGLMLNKMRKHFTRRDINHFILPSRAPQSWLSELFGGLAVGSGRFASFAFAEGIDLMSSSAFHPPETAAAPIRTFELRFVPAHRPVIEFPHPVSSVNDQHEEPLSKPGCIRGVRSALAIEAAMALLIYGLWLAWRLLR
ncbi:MAG TPA: hypothetical protein VK720_10190 [Terracidiphilus sp.]|nr:hypothetical protein [Terracidiphilus sp.]